MRYIIILFVFFQVFGCKNQIDENEAIDNYNNTNNRRNKTSNIILNYPYESNIDLSPSSIISIICITNINENDVNIRNYPSLDGEIIYKAQKDDIVLILGFSGEKEQIDGFEGYWLKIKFEKNENIAGWIFSKYINTNNREYSPLKFVEFIPGTDKRIPLIKLAYTLDGQDNFIELDFIDSNNYYTIAWGYHKQNFHYTTKPGAYIIDKETLKIKHITYLGSDAWALNWIQFTEDFEYLFQGGFKSSFTAFRIKDYY